MKSPIAAIVSFRLGGSDGVSVEARKWERAFGMLGFATMTVAGEGPVDHLVAGLEIGAASPPSRSELSRVLTPADVVVVENLCSLPLNPPALSAVAAVLRGRRAIMHHHDLPWQRQAYLHHPPPPQDRHWSHVVINELSRRQLAAHGIAARVLRNSFDVDTPPGNRAATRISLGVGDDELLVLQPTRAIPRKNIRGGIALAESLGATYWLLGPPEDGYAPELDRLVAAAGVRVLRGPPPPGAAGSPTSIADAYAACDVVALPSTWEGFGNPALESAVHRRPLAIGPYPVALELAAFGFHWFSSEQPAPLASWLADPDPALLEHNLWIARNNFSVEDLPEKLAGIIGSEPRPGPKPAQPALRHSHPRGATTLPAVLPGVNASSSTATPSVPTSPPTRRLTARERRRQLVGVALRLFADRGFNATTMDDIADAAGVTKPLLYQHFASKRALYLELVEDVAADMVTAIEHATAEAGGPRQQVEGGFEAYFSLLATRQDAFKLLFGSDVPDDPELSRALRSVEDSVAEAVDVLIDAGLEPSHRRMLAYAVVGMAEGASRHWLSARSSAPGAAGDLDATRMARRLADLAWAGLRSVHSD